VAGNAHPVPLTSKTSRRSRSKAPDPPHAERLWNGPHEQALLEHRCTSGALRAALPVMRPFSFIDFSGQDMGGGRQLLTTTTLFRAEPYSGKSCT
jgi:hypothetical protein